jgi:hypothetical protein
MEHLTDKRRFELNRIKEQIRREKNYIHTDSLVIERMKKLNDTWSLDQVESRKVKNSLREIEILQLQKRAESVKRGELDNQLELIVNDKKREEIQPKQKKDYKIRVNDSSSKRSDNNIKREIEKHWQYFVKTRETIPEYMIKKLKNMPNNKGYIWKNIYCYGERPAVIGEPVILFETQKDGVLVIHETTDKEYKIWYKKGTAKKTLHSCTPRRKIGTAVSSLGSYIKTKNKH